MYNLSIIIPAYNCEKYLEDCLNSIFSKITSNEEVEVLVIDDGSTDNTSSIYEKFKKENLKIFYQDNSGVSSARNLGILKALGKWLMFVDSDDFLSDNWYEIVSNNFDKDADVIYMFDNKNVVIKNKNDVIKSIIGVENRQTFLSPVWSKLYKRNLIIKNEIIFNKDLINGEDMLFNLEVILSTNNYIVINDKNIYIYRVNIFSSTSKFNKKIFLGDMDFHRKLEEILYHSEVEEELKKELKNFCLENSLLVLMQRLVRINNYKKIKVHLSNFLLYPYNKIKIKKIKNKKDILIFLINKRMYFIVYIIIKIKFKIENLLSKKDKEILKRI